MEDEKHCHICYTTDVEFKCDMCDKYYCEECSYTYTIHYQHQGGRCYWCSDQKRKKPLTIASIRENKLKLILGK